MKISSVCVYCGSSSGSDGKYVRAAQALGRCLASGGMRLVYGGGGIGLMGAVADAVMDSGGAVTGVIPEFLEDKELGHPGVQEMHVVATMHERKLKMIELSDAFVAMPGGFGTMEELFEVLAWSQLELHAKPVGLLNVDGFYDGLLRCLDHMVGEKLLRQKDRDRLVAERAAEPLLGAMAQWSPPSEPKWEDPEFWDERV